MKRHYKTLFWATVLGCLCLGLWLNTATPATNAGTGDIVINELVASNVTGLVDEDGETSDWIELYNRGSQAANLSGWALTDDPNQPEKWMFPNITLNSGDYLVVFASGKNRQPTGSDSPLHTNFRLNKRGDFLGLYRLLDQRFIDAIEPQFPGQLQDIAYGRYSNGAAFVFLEPATPGQPNDAAQVWPDIVAPVAFSVNRGFFDSPFTVALTSTTPGAMIRYTLDASEPSEESGVAYTEPIEIESTTLLRAAAFKPQRLPSDIQTHSYIFLDDVVRQPADPPGFPYGADYAMDPRVVNDPRYSDQIDEALLSIPSISLVTDMQNLDIYQNPTERGVEWERPVSVEFIDPANGSRNFHINAGARIQGGVGRQKVYPKHSMRLFFKGMYGATKLEQPIFPDSSVTAFDTLVLRGGVNRTFAGYVGLGDRAEDLRRTTYARDEWLRASQIAMSGVGSHGIFVHLYLNGLYWGLYNVVERPDASFTSSYLGGEREDWYAGNLDGVVSGDSARFDKLHALARAGNLDDPEKYAVINSYLDIEQFADYIILNFYAGNTDWAHNNWYAGLHNPDGKVNYFVWDGEKIWFDGAKTYLGKEEFGGKRNRVKRLVNALMENDDFRMTLADRLYKHLFNDGPLTEANARVRWLDISAQIEQAIIAESARWGDVVFNPPLTQADWRVARDDVLAQMDGNAAKLVALAREAGYYPPVDPPTFNKAGGQVTAGFKLVLSPTPGEGNDPAPPADGHTGLYVTTDGSDPRRPVSGAIAPGATRYTQPLVLTTTTTVKARSLRNNTWSALNEAAFYVADPTRQLRITELMYNPPEGGDYEFIELKNTGSGEFNLADAGFEGIEFTFPPNTPPLAPGQFIVLARDPVAFAEKYPDVAVFGAYRGQLSNGGETIALRDQSGQVIVSAAYDDENGWPLSPDGQGDSLVLTDPGGDPDSPKSWQASSTLGGSPGMDDSGSSALP